MLSKYQIPSENTLKGYKLLEQPRAGRKHWCVVVTPLLENTTKKAGRRVSLGNSGAGPGLLIVKWKDPDAGKDWRQEEKGVTEDEMVGWRHWLTQWTWVWASSRRWWRTGKPGVLQPIGSQSWTWLNDWLITMNVYSSPGKMLREMVLQYEAWKGRIAPWHRAWGLWSEVSVISGRGSLWSRSW